MLAHARERVAAEGVSADFLWAAGDPANVLVDVARDRGASLVVVGTHHHSFLAKLVGERRRRRGEAPRGGGRARRRVALRGARGDRRTPVARGDPRRCGAGAAASSTCRTGSASPPSWPRSRSESSWARRCSGSRSQRASSSSSARSASPSSSSSAGSRSTSTASAALPAKLGGYGWLISLALGLEFAVRAGGDRLRALGRAGRRRDLHDRDRDADADSPRRGRAASGRSGRSSSRRASPASSARSWSLRSCSRPGASPASPSRS